MARDEKPHNLHSNFLPNPWVAMLGTLVVFLVLFGGVC